MSNEFNLITCCLCNVHIGFNFENKLPKNNYCYECGHSILLIKSKFSEVNWDKISDNTPQEYQQSKINQTAVYYFLNKLE